MDQHIINVIAGNIPVRDCQPADHPITSAEREFAIEIAEDMACQSGIDLAEHVAAFHRRNP